MTLLTPKLALSALGIVTMINGLAFAQQYTSQVEAVGPGGELPQYVCSRECAAKLEQQAKDR
jgi:hypothetical protein